MINLDPFGLVFVTILLFDFGRPFEYHAITLAVDSAIQSIDYYYFMKSNFTKVVGFVVLSCFT